ncbi:MAG: hypothetical protein EZS28_048962, partial [Streblomastix strix]
DKDRQQYEWVGFNGNVEGGPELLCRQQADKISNIEREKETENEKEQNNDEDDVDEDDDEDDDEDKIQEEQNERKSA